MRAVPAVIRRCLADNKLFALALIPAVLLRVDAELGYRWQSWFNDSFSYVSSAVSLTPETSRPSGYPVYLWLLSPFHSYFLVTASQHLMGVLVGVMIYALARRRFAAPAWVAVLATLPVLYDGFEIQLEHLIMTDTLFLFLAFAALTVLLWNPRPSWRACLAAGLLLGPVHHRPLDRARADPGVRALPADPVPARRRRRAAGPAGGAGGR